MTTSDETGRLEILNLLTMLSSLKGDFAVDITPQPQGAQNIKIKPAITTFSDHIVISYQLGSICQKLGESIAATIVLGHAQTLLGMLAARALRLGFLFRGGATIGKLHHSAGVVFGEAMVDAYDLEAGPAVYPRVILSPKITTRSEWMKWREHFLLDGDGLYHIDYFREMLFRAETPGDGATNKIQVWFSEVSKIIGNNLEQLEADRQLNPFAKWSWFARQFRTSLEKVYPGTLEAFGITLDLLPAFH